MNNALLPELDVSFLKEKEYETEFLTAGTLMHVLIKDFPFPVEHYTPAKADLLIEIPPAYPNAPLDMFWTNPEIKLINGTGPRQTESRAEYYGRTWQRWSRHYAVAWRPGVDSIKNFIQSIAIDLKKGL